MISKLKQAADQILVLQVLWLMLTGGEGKEEEEGGRKRGRGEKYKARVLSRPTPWRYREASQRSLLACTLCYGNLLHEYSV